MLLDPRSRRNARPQSQTYALIGKSLIKKINYTPSFTTDTPFDKHVKKNLINDALALLGITDEWKH